MQSPSIGFIVPSYNAMDYLRRTLRSVVKYTPNIQVIVVDDASTEWDLKWVGEVPSKQLTQHRFSRQGGLTRSWNRGFYLLSNLKVVPTYTVFANNDILMTPGWWRGLVATVDNGYAMAGPVSNAAGVTAAGKQDVANYVANYQVTDEPAYNNAVAEALWRQHGYKMVESTVNGFFMFGRTSTFAKNGWDAANVFQPRIDYMPSGRRNPTPTMTGQEDELQARWSRRGLKSAIAVGSFVFHYRSVSRGQKFARKGWYRCSNSNKDV